MSMLLFMYSDFIVVVLILIASALLLWMGKQRCLLTPVKATGFWTAILFVCLFGINQRYGVISPDKNYLTTKKPQALDIAPLVRAQQRYFGVTYNGQQNLNLLSKHINSATPPNELKWVSLLAGDTLGDYDFSKADSLVNELLRKDIKVRGHTLIWGKWAGRTFPNALKEVVNSSEFPTLTLKQQMNNHITTVMHHFSGRVERWDVVNEPLTMDNKRLDDNFFFQVLGEDYILEAFKMARVADPNALLFINEDFRDFTPETTQRFISIIKRQLDQGAPIDGIGIQAHHIYRLKDITLFRAFINDLKKLNLLVEITELDVPIWLFAKSEAPFIAQGNYYREFSQSCYQVLHCLGVTTWGTDDSTTWLDFIFPFSLRAPNQPLLFDHNMIKKPAYQGVVDALKQTSALSIQVPSK